MPLKLMYITNSPEIAKIADSNGVDYIFLDLEKLGKEKRQKNMDTVKSNHSISDIKIIKSVLKKSKLLVRINPINKNSKNEINEVLLNGADVIMLPYFKTKKEVETFIKFVDKRAKTMLLFETDSAVKHAEEILMLQNIDYVHIGLNDLHLDRKKDFMFELVSDNTVGDLCEKFKKTKITYGFGGIARLGNGIIPAEYIMNEHYYYGSELVILSRSFCNTSINSVEETKKIFGTEMKKLREYEEQVSKFDHDTLSKNHFEFCKKVNQYVQKIKETK